MSDDFRKFIETLKAPGTIKVVNSMQALGAYDYSDCTAEDIERIVLSMQPNSPKAVITICYVLGLYARYLQNDRMYQMIQEIAKTALWAKAKPNAPKKYISHVTFEDVYHDIGVYEEYNGFYLQTLFRCLYEGIYNDDLSVVKNLRASDVNGNVVTLREDNGHSYELAVSDRLAEDLRELGNISTWERNNRYGSVAIAIGGLHPDSCFKVENRKGTALDSNYRFVYYRMLRKISNDYLECNLLPLQLYVSGMMYRMGLKLEKQGIRLEDAFAEDSRDRSVASVISNELKRCNCDTEVRNFREMVKGHLDVFAVPQTKNQEIAKEEIPMAESKPKKAMLNTTISENVLNDFREYCKSINCPMNTVIEIFMQQFASGQFGFKLVKNKMRLDVDE